jgi:hypothetical protein
MISYSSSEGRQLRRVAFVGAITLVVSSSVFAVACVAFRNDGPRYPARWDPRVAPIAIKVEALRGLTFKHPVKINYLTTSAFEEKLTATPHELKKQKKQIDQATALLRAAGLVGVGFDLAAATNTAQAAETIAFYSERDEQIYMRAGPFTIETRVTLAHELTHVLQDQHFDLSELRKRADASESGSSDALIALIEGDADRIEHRYLARRTVGERRAYRRLSSQRSAVSDQRTKAVPELISLYFSAPYIFGPQVIRVLDTAGGNAAIDRALTAPALSTRIYFNPAAVHEPAPAEPPIPSLNTDEEKLTISGDDTSFDAFTFYLMLAAQLDRPDALRAADAFASGSEATYTRAGVVCFRAAILGATPASTSYIASILRRWTHGVADGALESSAGPVIFHACDAGPRAATPDDGNFHEAASLAVTRDELVTTFMREGIDDAVAACTARLLVQDPNVRDALFGGESLDDATVTMLQESTFDAVVTCRLDEHAGLPGVTP